MTGPESWQEVESWHEVSRLFEAALELEPRQRDAFLASEVRDGGTRRAVVELLRYDERAGGFLEEPALDAGTRLLLDGTDLPSDTVLDRYRIVRRLGAGGMGTVYLAERCDQRYRQRVAIKVLHLGLASPELRRLFQRERQILATLEHPAIARLIDGGELTDGRPYLVMEYVEGQSIDRYCESRSLSIQARLELFLDVCAAVNAAHQRLIVHRDLKPSNILVDADGRLKLVDFGTAGLLEAGIDSQTDSEPGFATPAYASPEQATGARATVAMDVYSLGTVLFQLLTGERPGAGSDKSSLSSAVTGSLGRRLKGDLDAIVILATCRDPTRRYATVAELATDVRHHLKRLPVAARPRTLPGRAWLFGRRHPWTSLATVIILLVITGFVSSLRHERDRTAAAANRAERASAFLVDLFEVIDPEEAPNESLTAQDLLTRGVRLLDEQPMDDLLRLRIANGLAERFLKLGHPDEARDLLAEAPSLFERDARAANEPEAAVALGLLGRAALRSGDWEAAVTWLQGVLEQEAPWHHAPRIVARALADLAEVRVRRGELDLAGPILEKALDLGRNALSERDPELGRVHAIAGFWHHQAGRLELALHHHQQALYLAEARGGRHQPAVAEALGDLALLHRQLGDSQAALKAGQEALAIQTEIFRADHPAVAVGYHNLGSLFLRSGELFEARKHLEEAVERAEQIAAGDPFGPARSRRFLAYTLYLLGSFPEAERQARDALTPPEGMELPHRHQAMTLTILAQIVAESGRWDEAEAAYRRALELCRGVDAAITPRVYGHFLRVLVERGRLTRARELLDEVHSQHLPETASTPILALAEADLATVEGDFERAEARLQAARELVDEEPGHPWHADWSSSRSALSLARGEVSEALASARRALAIASDRTGENGPLTVRARAAVAAALGT